MNSNNNKEDFSNFMKPRLNPRINVGDSFQANIPVVKKSNVNKDNNSNKDKDSISTSDTNVNINKNNINNNINNKDLNNNLKNICDKLDIQQTKFNNKSLLNDKSVINEVENLDDTMYKLTKKKKFDN